MSQGKPIAAGSRQQQQQQQQVLIFSFLRRGPPALLCSCAAEESPLCNLAHAQAPICIGRLLDCWGEIVVSKKWLPPSKPLLLKASSVVRFRPNRRCAGWIPDPANKNSFVVATFFAHSARSLVAS